MISVMMVLLLMLLLGGCRPSPVIEQIIYDQAADEVDWDSEVFLSQDIPDSEKDKNMPPEDFDESKIKDKTIVEAEREGDGNAKGSVPGTKPEPKAKEEGAPPPAEEETPEAEDKSDEIKEPEKTDEVDDEKPADKGDDGSGSVSENPNSKQITDDSGKIIDLPEDVSAVVATAKAAGIVQMLGGKNILAGTAADFMNNSLAMKVFAAQVVSAPAILWDGDGSSRITDSNFSSLLALKPAVCVAVSGDDSFSEAQIGALKDHKIAYVTIPVLSTHSNIQSAVEIIGKMIGDRSKTDGGVDAKALADSYKSYVDSLLSKVKNKAGEGKYTLYISDWDKDAVYKMTDESVLLLEENGLAVTPRGDAGSALNYYMEIGGTKNNGAAMDKGSQKFYPVLPVNVNMRSHKITGSSSLDIYPMLTESYTRVKSIDVCLGEIDFPAVVAANNTVKDAINASDRLWKVPENRTVDGHTDYGYYGISGDDTTWITSYIRDAYEVLVNPGGVGDWTEGSQESFLESIWIAAKFTGKYSDGDVVSEIKSFYKQFYRYDLSDSEVSEILKGK